MNRILFTSILLCFLTAAGCGGDVLISVESASDADMTDVVVDFGRGEVFYGELQAGAKSEYRLVDSAYSYAYVRTSVDGDDRTTMPIDYIGEKHLSPGHYTYVLSLGSTSSSLFLVLRED